MRIFIKAKPGAKIARIEKNPETLFSDKAKDSALHLTVSVKEPPQDGRANRAITLAVAEYLGVSPSRVSMISGHTSKNKILEITGT